VVQGTEEGDRGGGRDRQVEGVDSTAEVLLTTGCTEQSHPETYQNIRTS